MGDVTGLDLEMAIPGATCDVWEIAGRDVAAGVDLRLAIEARGTVASISLVVTVDGLGFVTVLDPAVPMPRRGLEFRAPGLWLDVSVAEALVQATLGVEAFAVVVDTVEQIGPDARGDRVPLGIDVDWTTTGRRDSIGLDLECGVFGDIVIGDRRLRIDGTGRRSHHWQTPPEEA